MVTIPVSATWGQYTKIGDGLDQRVYDIFKSKCTMCHDDHPDPPRGFGHLTDFEKLGSKRATPAFLRKLVETDTMPKEDMGDQKWNGKLNDADKASVLEWIDRGVPSQKWNLDKQVTSIIKSKCAMCHDDRGSDAAGNVADLTDLHQLTTQYVDQKNPEKSLLLDFIQGEDPFMPIDSYDGVDSNGSLTSEELAAITEWVLQGGTLNSEEPRKIFSLEEIDAIVEQDFENLNPTLRENSVYLTLSHFYNDRSVGSERLDMLRQGLVKALNCVSLSSDILGLDNSNAKNKLVALDNSERTIFRLNLQHLGWTTKKWNQITQFYPFATTSKNNQIRHIRGDWAAFVILQAPLYHDLLNIPKSLEELEQTLGFDLEEALNNGKSARAGMVESNVAHYNRIIIRATLPDGRAFHISMDFSAGTGQQEVMTHPFDPRDTVESSLRYKPAGGEIIFHLRNGMIAGVLIDSQGNRLNSAPESIVVDREFLIGTSTVINGISCIACHYEGFKPESNKPRLALLDEIRGIADQSRSNFTIEEHEFIRNVFLPHAQFKALINEDQSRFKAALKQMGINKVSPVEPASELFKEFSKNLNLKRIAAEFGKSPVTFSELMDRNDITRVILTLAERGTLTRQSFIDEKFSVIANHTAITETRSFKKILLPFFGEDPSGESPKLQKIQSLVAAGKTEVDLIDAKNETGPLKVDIWTEGKRQRFDEDEAIVTKVRANQDCYLTIIVIDSVGDVAVLAPNWLHKNPIKLVANRIFSVPNEQMKFDFGASPPHGLTLLKAIVTRKPLELIGVDDEALEKQMLAVLGNVKSIKVREKTGPVLTKQSMEKMFAPEDWATSTWILTTQAKTQQN